MTRTEALNQILDDLTDYEIKYSQYYEDLEPQGYYDIELTGKVLCLRAFFSTLGWSGLVEHIDSFLPLRGNAQIALDSIKGFIIPEARLLLEKSNIEETNCPLQWFWDFIHPRISALARPRYESGFYGDAVESSFKEINDSVKRLVRDKNGKEYDGAALMNTAFSVQNPIIQLTDLSTESERNEQIGYMQIMAGSMTGIRNPKAHSNINPDSTKTLHLICLASLLMRKIDERKESP